MIDIKERDIFMMILKQRNTLEWMIDIKERDRYMMILNHDIWYDDTIYDNSLLKQRNNENDC